MPVWKHGLGVMRIVRNRLKASTAAGQPELVGEHQSPAGRGGHPLAESRTRGAMATGSTCQPAPGQTQPRSARHGTRINKLLERASESRGNSIPAPQSAAMWPLDRRQLAAGAACRVGRPGWRLPVMAADTGGPEGRGVPREQAPRMSAGQDCTRALTSLPTSQRKGSPCLRSQPRSFMSHS